MTDPYYPFYPGDYQRVTSGLTLIEHGAYRVLLDEYYSTGPLPIDFDRLFRITRAMSDEEKEAVKNVIKTYFHNKNGNYHNTKADNIIEKRDSFLKSQAEKSAKGVAARKKPTGQPTGQPGGEPLPSPSPSPSLKPNTKEKELCSLFEDFWKTYPKKNGKKKALQEWKKAKIPKDVISILESQIKHKSEMKANAQFTPEFPDPERWIKNERWNDEPGELEKELSVEEHNERVFREYRKSHAETGDKVQQETDAGASRPVL